MMKKHIPTQPKGGQRGTDIPQILKNGKNTHIMPYRTFSNIKYPQNTLKMKINKYFFKINSITAGDIPIYGHPEGEKTQILTKNYPKCWY